MPKESEDEIIKNAIGDTISNEILFKNESKLVDISILNRILSIIPDLLSQQAEEKTSKIFNRPIASHLNRQEQPHFILKCKSEIEQQEENEVRTITSSSEFGSPRLVVTDERIVIIIGQLQQDVVKSIEYSKLANIEMESTLLNTSISIESESISYHVDDCVPPEEIRPAVAYARAQSDDKKTSTDWSDEDFDYEKGDTKSERLGDVVSDLDMKKIGNSGVEGAIFGKRLGSKGTAIGFTLGAGYEVYRQVSNIDISSTTTPDPSHVARNIKKWKKAGSQTNNKKLQWLSASVGVGVTFASENADQKTAELLDDLNPDPVVSAIESGATMAGNSDLAPVPNSNSLDKFPEIEHLQQPVGEMTSTVKQLTEEGIFDEIADSK
jgi:hypothetical protein